MGSRRSTARRRPAGRTGVLLAVTALLALAAACSGADGPPPGAAGSNATTATTAVRAGGAPPDGPTVVRLGALNAETGPGAPYGRSQRRGLELAVREANEAGTLPGVHLEVVARDDATDVAVAKRAMTELIDQEHVSVVLGPTTSPVAAQVDRIAIAAGVPVLAISNTTLDLLTVDEPFWRLAVTDPVLARTNLAAVHDKYGTSRAAVVWDPSDPTSRHRADQLRSSAVEVGLEVEGEATFTTGDGDLSDTVRQAQSLDAEVLLVAATGDDARRFFDSVDQESTALDFSKVGDAVWRVALSESTMIADSVAATVARRGVRRAVLVLDPNDSYSAGAARAFRLAAAVQGVEVVGEATFTQGAANDFGPAFALARDRGADALFVSSLAGDGVQLLQQRAAAGNTSVVVGSDGFASTELIEQAGAAAEGVIGATAWIGPGPNPASAEFVRRFTAAYGEAPDAWAALGYAGVQAFVEAVRTGGGTSLAQIRAGLAATDLETVVGPLTFGPDREAGYPAVVQVVEGGRFVAWTG